MMANAQGFFRQQSGYVPKMQYSADVNYNGLTRVDFSSVSGAFPAAANPTQIANATSVAVAGNIDLSNTAEVPEMYGRTLTVVLSGAGTGTATVNGWDYLGQPVSEAFTLAGATPVVGKKAFKSVRNVNVPAIAATTMNIGTGTGFGLPYKAIRCSHEIAGGVLAAAGTLTAASIVDPATAVTGDPRGTYVPTTTPNGATWITAVFEFINDVNTAGNGGLHGIAQFAA
jgi:hypothetical protein